MWSARDGAALTRTSAIGPMSVTSSVEMKVGSEPVGASVVVKRSTRGRFCSRRGQIGKSLRMPAVLLL